MSRVRWFDRNGVELFEGDWLDYAVDVVEGLLK